MHTKLVLGRIGVVSLARVSGALYALLGFIGGAIITLFSIFGASFGSSGMSFPGSGFGPLFGVAAIILLPVLYGLMGFVGALICGALYNVVVGVVGGIEIEAEQTPPVSAPIS